VAGKATFPRQYALLSRQLLSELSRHLAPDQLAETMARIGETLASGVADQIDPADPIPSIAALMRQLGYESTAVNGADGPEIEAHNCVFHDLAMADQAICDVDLALLRSLSGKAGAWPGASVRAGLVSSRRKADHAWFIDCCSNFIGYPVPHMFQAPIRI
jgi:predicted ArsR family transcriptional regulator